LREKVSCRLSRLLYPAEPVAEARLSYAHGMTMRLKPSDIGHRSIQINGFYELALTRQITTLARSGGMLVDAGANYGYFSILWLANNPVNRCVAFEAAPGNTPALQDNIQRNGLSERIQVETMALSDQTGWVDFIPEDTGGQTGWGGITRQALAGSIRVPATTLDQYWIKHYPGQHIAVLKIDVEGADTKLLDIFSPPRRQDAEQLVND
jgi:FkbM family methyltransferase